MLKACGLRMLPTISVNKVYHSHQQLQPPPTVSLEGTQDGNKECQPSSSHQTTATPLMVHLEETQDEKTQDTGPR